MSISLKKLINLKDIKEKMVLIEGNNTDYITTTGKIFKKYEKDKFFPKKISINKSNKYVYCGITMKNGKNKSCRVHRLVAKAFIDNPNGYNIVGHKNNIKHDNRVENLYWTTIQENTKKAFDDGLAKNRKGYEDEQSYPVIAYDTNMNEIGKYGSVTICAKTLGVSKSTILRHCNFEIKGNSKCKYTFRFQ